jgi:hypothetical protein
MLRARWREAFEVSDGLLLEYLHVLTTGDTYTAMTRGAQQVRWTGLKRG